MCIFGNIYVLTRNTKTGFNNKKGYKEVPVHILSRVQAWNLK